MSHHPPSESRQKSLVAAVAASILALVIVAPAHAGPGAPVMLTVNCSAGDTIAKALQVADTTFERVTIVVSGVCNERVLIARDDITLQAGASGAVIDGAGLAGNDPLVTVSGHRVVLDALALTPAGIPGLDLAPGAAVAAAKLEVDEAGIGIRLRHDTDLVLRDSSVIESQEAGISNEGGALEMMGTTVAKGYAAGVQVDGGSLRMSGCKITDNDAWGVSVTGGGSATIVTSSVDGNRVGLFVRMSATALVGSGTTVNGNDLEGIRVWDGSSALLGAGATVAQNGFSGVEIEGGSVLVPQQTTIKGNGHHGIEAHDTSLVKSTNGLFPTIHHNAWWGVWCEGAPGDARLGTPGFPPTSVFSNVAGQLTCPGYFLP